MVELFKSNVLTKLHALGGAPLGPVTLLEVDVFLKLLPCYQITVYTGPSPDSVTFQGQIRSKKNFNLFLFEGHYYVIGNVAAFFG